MTHRVEYNSNVMISRKTVFLLLLAILLVSIVIRYPLVGHERNQSDSYFIHLLSESIVNSGYAKWTFHPLSYLGYFPFSYPSGMPFLLGEFSMLTGLNLESTILLADFMLAIMFALGVFGLARQFVTRPQYVLLATLLAVLGPRFVDTTYWVASARGPIVVLITLVAFVSFRAALGQRRLLIFTVILGAGCFVTHHMAVLLVVFALGYLLAAFLAQFVLKRVDPDRRIAVAAGMLLAVLVAGIILLSVLGYFELMGFDVFSEVGLFDIDHPVLLTVLNMAVSFTHQVGLVLVFAFISAPYLLKGRSLHTETLYLLALPIAFVPLLGNLLYTSMLLSPFIAILGIEWFRSLRKSSRSKLRVSFVLVVLIAASVALPFWSVNRWNSTKYVSGATVEVPDQVFSDACYMRWEVKEFPAISNVGLLGGELAATSGVTFLGGGVQMALSGDIRYEDILNNVTWSSSDFPRNLYIWFEYQNGEQVGLNLQRLLNAGVAFAKNAANYSAENDYFSTHSKLVVVVDNLWPEKSVDPYSSRDSTLMVEVRTSTEKGGSEIASYKMYQSFGVTLYMLQLPIRGL
jgi:hypothetical protein